MREEKPNVQGITAENISVRAGNQTQDSQLRWQARYLYATTAAN